MWIFFRKKIKKSHDFVEPDEIFLDSANLAGFNQQQFEGRIESPINKKSIIFLGMFFLLIGFVFLSRLSVLQIKEGEAYFTRSENNKLEKIIVFAERGIIYDRHGVELAWNSKKDFIPNELNDKVEKAKPETDVLSNENIFLRTYRTPGFSHVLGYVSSPIQDQKGKYWQEEFIGKEGVEKVYNDLIKGKNGEKLIEKDALGNIVNENTLNQPQRGLDVYLTIDARIQESLFKIIQKTADTHRYRGGAGIIMDIENGEVLASVSYPEYDSNVLSTGNDAEKIKNYINDPKNLFLNKTISGLYTPGSIVKPFFALAALNEKIIDPKKEILSTGSISIPNPYNPNQPTIFRDWKAHGFTDMREAIAVSSDVYFYAIGGGYQDQKGMGIANIEKYSKVFGIGEKTGVDLLNEEKGIIPNPEWKKKYFNGDIWRVGDTYNTSIGQYGFQVTLLEMVRAVSALANHGKLITPHFLIGNSDYFKKDLELQIPKEYFDIVHEGMYGTVKYGTAMSLNVPYTKVAAKTGTAQVGISKSRINSWVIGFFPYEKPKYAFTVMMEQGPSGTGVGASFVMRQLLDFIYQETPEYFGLTKTETKVKKSEELSIDPILESQNISEEDFSFTESLETR